MTNTTPKQETSRMTKTPVTLYASAEELDKLESLCRHYMRKSKADGLRYLINSAYVKIFSPVFANTNNAAPSSPSVTASESGK